MLLTLSRRALAALLLSLAAFARAEEIPFKDRLPQDEVVYFLMVDRFEKGDPAQPPPAGDRMRTGYDPTDKNFFNGGTLAGVTRRLDYIQGLGATAIWLSPIFRNKPVQGTKGHAVAGYHGYWITDFTDVDPHFGTRDQFKALVEAAHARGIKIYLDIVVNHTADVIRYRECPTEACPYRSEADYPYTRRGGVAGPPINEGFAGTDAAHQTPENFAKLTDPGWAYTPYVPAEEAHEKKPDWLNDPIWYHNRGNTDWRGESVTTGDFGGLDDVFTENPRVLGGFIDIYGAWIDEFAIDGFRIDTAKHVNPEFWHAFVPAMEAHARAKGIEHFPIFGEVSDADPGMLAAVVTNSGLPAVLDFAFLRTVVDTVAKGGPTDLLARLYAEDAAYPPGVPARLPTFTGNHDFGRFGWFVRKANPHEADGQDLARVELGYALSFFARGVPVVYYGDEQGFAGTGEDNLSRQSMFPSLVAEYNAERLIGTRRTTAVENFDPGHPLYRALAEMARIRREDPNLRRGLMNVRASSAKAGLFAFTRRADPSGPETLVAVNTGLVAVTAQVEVDARSTAWRAVHGDCPAAPNAPGSYRITLPPLAYAVCAAAATDR